jgi:hypothetical protein
LEQLARSDGEWSASYLNAPIIRWRRSHSASDRKYLALRRKIIGGMNRDSGNALSMVTP